MNCSDISVEIIRKYKNIIKKMKFRKNVQVQLISFSYTCVKTIGKCDDIKQNFEKITSLANDLTQV